LSGTFTNSFSQKIIEQTQNRPLRLTPKKYTKLGYIEIPEDREKPSGKINCQFISSKLKILLNKNQYFGLMVDCTLYYGRYLYRILEKS
jgi:hypothetical protein